MISFDELSAHSELKCYAAQSIVFFGTEHSWYYTSCRRCNIGVRFLYEYSSDSTVQSTLVCDTCWPKTPVLCPRFKVEFTAVNKSGSTSFTLFVADVQRLVKISCADLLKRIPAETICPDELIALFEAKMLFKIEVSAFNWVNNCKVYTVKEVTNNLEFVKSYFFMKIINEDVVANIEEPIPLLEHWR